MPRNQSKLEAAREFERAQAAKIPASERPLFHLTPMVGWMNDPNGFCYYNGEYHLFYQYNPYSTVWGPMHWGHAVTTDLLHWTWQPAALAPDTAADAGGCFSGTAVETPDGQLLLMYTGVQPASTGHAELQAQCVAIGNGVDFRKVSQNPVLDASALPAGYSAVDFRDPKIWRENDKYYCAAGNRHETRQGSILLFESPDALHWTFVTELDSSDNEYGRMWECPDFFPLDGKQLLLVSPQEMQANRDGEFHAGYGTIALLGHWDAGTRTFTREQVQPIDHGLDFYAPQTTLAPDGRRIMVGWMVNWETCGSEPRVHPWFGRMSLPRELHLRHGRLYQTPVRELPKPHSLFRRKYCRCIGDAGSDSAAERWHRFPGSVQNRYPAVPCQRRGQHHGSPDASQHRSGAAAFHSGRIPFGQSAVRSENRREDTPRREAFRPSRAARYRYTGMGHSDRPTSVVPGLGVPSSVLSPIPEPSRCNLWNP